MKKMMIACSMLVFLFTSCSKKIEEMPHQGTTVYNEFIKYTIAKGSQTCDKNIYTPVEYDELSFIVKFDSSAIYSTKLPSNQTDINKLFGFSDNNTTHHQFSARFGWRWTNNALRLFAYVYNNGGISFKEIGIAKIGAEINCSIKISGDKYLFTMGEKTQTMTRSSTTPKAIGYKLYPYFGGDEFAPHAISIWIKEMP